MRATLTIAVLGLLVAVSPLSAQTRPLVHDAVQWGPFLARQDLVWDMLPTAWDGGAFLGNGLLGAMIYSDKTCPMRWDVGRSDVTDHRGKPGESPNVCFDRARLPIGHFVLEPVGKPTGGKMRLNLWDAEATGTLITDQGRITWRSLVHASDMSIVVELQTEGKERDCHWKWVAEDSRSTRTRGARANYKPNPPCRIEKVGPTNVCIQPLLVGGQYATSWQEQRLGADHRLLWISVGNSYPGESAAKEAVAAVRNAADAKFTSLLDWHREWWHEFYPASFVSIPDARLESFYWIQMYKLGSATRADRPAIDLMGPWFRTTGWPAIWWNLNIQLTYYPVYVSNRLELGESLCRMLDGNVENLILNVKPEFRHDSAAIGRVSGYDCRGNVANEVGDLTWACHNYWRQYCYSMDDARLRNRLYPLLRRCVNYYLHLLENGDDGRLHLPETLSPEYGTARDCNYDLSLLRWGCQTLLQTCQRLKINDPLIPKWREVLAKLTDYPQGRDGLWIGRDRPLAHSHRHYSHLLMIYPLHLLNWEQ
jgi:alpha-L-fucosidase 2